MPTAHETFALTIVRRLQAAGATAYFAGGCVRDRLLGRPPKDFDVATSATPAQVLALFPRSQKVGVAFGVVLVRDKPAAGRGQPSGQPTQVEVATFRSDGTYTDGRHPDSVEFTTPEHDARRRDFTCNGLFFDPLANGGTGQLHDFVGGQADIAARTLRAIGNPEARFREDHLRLLRAVRFAARLDFAIEPATRAAIEALAPQIRSISKERIHDELATILTHPSRAAAAHLLHATQLLRHIWPPELFQHPEVARQWQAIALLPADADFVVALITLHEDIQYAKELHPHTDPPGICQPGSRIAELLRRELLLTNTETADLAWLCDHQRVVLLWRGLSKARLKRLLADPRWERLATLYRTFAPEAEAMRAFQEHIAALQSEGVAPAPFITGETLIKLGAAPGPTFKGWLDQLYDRQLENEFPTQNEAFAAARTLVVAGTRSATLEEPRKREDTNGSEP